MKVIIRTEERPKRSTVAKVLNTVYSSTLGEHDIIIIPECTPDGRFSFLYSVQTRVSILGISEIKLQIVSGSSSFIDYLIFEVNDFGVEYLKAMIEETKTDDSESRNTGVYQRASKFVYANLLYPNVPKYMLYISESDSEKMPSETAQFGSKLLKTIGVIIKGKNSCYDKLPPFESVDEIIDFKNNMRRPPAGNTPILIKKGYDNYSRESYFISGILSKPKLAGNIAHDPNIGALTLISAGIRGFDRNRPIYITDHCVSQNYINNISGNKFLYIANHLNIALYGLRYNPNIFINSNPYYHQEDSSEKVTTIFLHIVLENMGARLIYENHAGCERGYFHCANGVEIALPKEVNCQKLYIPDLVMQLPFGKVLLIEGKKLSTLYKGIEELNNYGLIENNYINQSYDFPIIERWVTTFGGNIDGIPHEKVLIHINNDGRIFVNLNAPDEIKRIFGLI